MEMMISYFGIQEIRKLKEKMKKWNQGSSFASLQQNRELERELREREHVVCVYLCCGQLKNEEEWGPMQ